MTWDYLIWFGGAAALLWIAGALAGAFRPGKEVSMADSLAVHHVLQPAQGLFISQQFHQAFSNRSTLTTIMVAPPTVTSTGTGIDISGADMDR